MDKAHLRIKSLHASESVPAALLCETGEQCHSTVDPVPLWLLAWELEEDDKVGGVSRCGQGACPGQRLVHWAVIEAILRLLAVLDGLEPHDWHLGEQLLGPGLTQLVCLPVPPAEADDSHKGSVKEGDPRGLAARV